MTRYIQFFVGFPMISESSKSSTHNQSNKNRFDISSKGLRQEFVSGGGGGVRECMRVFIQVNIQNNNQSDGFDQNKE